MERGARDGEGGGDGVRARGEGGSDVGSERATEGRIEEGSE